MRKLLPLLFTLFFSSAASAQFPLPADRGFPWNPGMTSVGGIPANRLQCGATIAPSGGDDVAAIQAAVEACPGGQAVVLGPGTFVIGGTSNFILLDKGVTLRGSGAGVTILSKTNGATARSGPVVPGTVASGGPLNERILAPADQSPPDNTPIIVVGNARWPRPDSTTSRNLFADGAAGQYTVTVSSGAGFAVGQWVLVDEISKWALVPVPPGYSPSGVRVRAGDHVVMQMHDPSQGFVDDPPDAFGWFSRGYPSNTSSPNDTDGRMTAEIKEIASVSGNNITFTSPLSIGYRTSHLAQVTGYTANSNGGNGAVQVAGAGVENLTLKGGSDGALRFEVAAYSWAKNIECTQWIGECVAIDNSFRVELRDSYIHTGSEPTPGGAGYAISLSGGSSEILIENNISRDVNKVMVSRSSGAGSVVAYNYMDDGWISYAPTWQEIGLNASHMAGPHHVLFEGNYGFNMDTDYTHGSSQYVTYFRNYVTGQRGSWTGPDDNSRTAGVSSWAKAFTFVGNVMGRPGLMSGWKYVDPMMGCDAGGGNCVGGVSGQWGSSGVGNIWQVGYDATNQWSQQAEPGAISTVIRDGNYDFLTNSQRWHNTPGGYTIPNSLYLTAAPAFFGANTWPWVDPSTGTIYVNPAKARYDAGTPNAADGGGSPPPPVNGVCGSANGVPASSPPTAGLCSAGTAVPPSGPGPWSWTCTGSGAGHVNAICSAPLAQAGDTAPPSVPTALSANGVSPTEIDLTWTASTDNVGVAGYDVWRNGVKVGSPPGTSFADTGLTAGTTYAYTVDAFDAAGNVSAQSGAVNGTTLASANTIVIGDQDTSPTWIDNSGAHKLIAQAVVLPQNATLQKLSFYVSSAAGTLQLGIYDALGASGHPKNLKRVTPSFTPVVGWNTVTVAGPPLIAGNYWLAFLPTDIWLGYPTDWDHGTCVWKNNVAGTMPNTFSSSLSGSRICQRPFYATLSVP